MSRTRAFVCLAMAGLIAACSDAPVSPTTEGVRLARAHFIEPLASASVGNDGALTVAFRIAGLGGGASLDVILVAEATATYACMLSTGGVPPSPQTEVVGPTTVVGFGQFTSVNGGQVRGSLTLSPPAPSPSCPPGQVPALARVVYTDVGLSEANGQVASIPVAGTFSRTF